MMKICGVWSVNVKDFFRYVSEKDKLKFLINFAVLAPSSHNSQPWKFSIDNSIINVYLEQKRLLPVGDPNSRQAIISIGCAVENIIISADYYGYSASVQVFEKLNEKNLIVSIKLASKNDACVGDESHLIHQIVRRTVNRNKYTREIDQNTINDIEKLSTASTNIKLISDKKKISELADIALSATADSMANSKFRSELSRYVISNTSSKKFGMPGFTIGFPTTISYAAPFVLKMFNLSKMSNKQDEPLLKHYTPHIGIITTNNDTHLDWINTGILFEHISLMLSQKGASAAVWAAPIQIGEHFKKVAMFSGKEGRPQMFFRIGYAEKKVAHSPRMPSNELFDK